MKDTNELLKHVGHEIEVITYGDNFDSVSYVNIECETCKEILYCSFVYESIKDDIEEALYKYDKRL